MVSKEEICPKRFSQKDSLKKILSKISLFCQTRPRPPSPKFEMWFQKRKPAQNVSLKRILSKRFSQNDSLKTILSKRFSQNLLAPKPLTISINPNSSYKNFSQNLLSNEAPPPLTQIRNVVSKEETCPKRFSQKDSLKNFSLLSNEAPPPLTQIRNVVSKEETCPKRFSQKDSLKTILSKRFSQKDSLKKNLSKLIGTQTLNNFYKP